MPAAWLQSLSYCTTLPLPNRQRPQWNDKKVESSTQPPLPPSSPCHFQFQCSFLFPAGLGELVSFSFSAWSPCPLPVVHSSHHSTDSALSWGTSDLITRFHGQFSVPLPCFWNMGLLLIFHILKCSICYSGTRHFYFFYHLSNKRFFF